MRPSGQRALDRFQVIRPFLEDGVPLAQIAREQGISLRTARVGPATARTDWQGWPARTPR